jgi:hypothetical protein
MKAIRSAGIAFSRNKHFAFFSEPENRDALRLEKYLRRLGDGIARWGSESGGAIRVSPHQQDGRISVRVDVEHLSYRRTAYLKPAELRWIFEMQEVRSVLHRHGVLEEALDCLASASDGAAPCERTG